MSKRSLLLLLITLLGAGLVGLSPPAHAATKNWAYQATAGATYIKLADATISSDLTAESPVTGGPAASRSNSTAAVNVGTALRTGAVQTRSYATRTATTTTLTSWSRTAGVNLLAGLVRIDAVTTKVTTKGTTSGVVTSSGDTQFAGIHIAGLHLPLNIPKNYAATIPGVADVRLNYFRHGTTPSSSATLGWAAGLSLLSGLIRADAIKVVAHGRVKDGHWSSSMSMTTVNLVVAGQRIP
ncbi:MAG TPA: choice-of-anchor P family protein, partial [Nocardioides sp.]|nr:choice-of-anchor P family protein [Nocardioides sp.]